MRPFLWDKLDQYKRGGAATGRPGKGVMELMKEGVEIVRSLVEIKDVGGQVARLNTMKVVKIAGFFWAAIALQTYGNHRTRRVIFKTVFIIAGILSVLGALGTTGIILYKAYLGKQSRKEGKKFEELSE